MPLPEVQSLGWELLVLLVLAIPVACISWTITHEEIFRNHVEFFLGRSKDCKTIYQRKFFYALTCEYCLSHYVTAAVLIATRYRLLFDSWRGSLGSLAFRWFGWPTSIWRSSEGEGWKIKSQKAEIAQEEKDVAEKTHR